jgi:hypothetical protein
MKVRDSGPLFTFNYENLALFWLLLLPKPLMKFWSSDRVILKSLSKLIIDSPFRWISRNLFLVRSFTDLHLHLRAYVAYSLESLAHV